MSNGKGDKDRTANKKQFDQGYDRIFRAKDIVHDNQRGEDFLQNERCPLCNGFNYKTDMYFSCYTEQCSDCGYNEQFNF